MNQQTAVNPPHNRILMSLCLLIFFALALPTAVSKSPTVDESIHILRGRALWQTGKVGLQFEHAPLSHWLNGSLLWLEPTMPNVVDLPAWPLQDPLPLASQLLWQNGTNLDRAVLLARLPIILLGLLLGAALARWARELGGYRAEWVVLILFAFSPNLLANFSLATTDAPLTAVFLFSLYTHWRWQKRPSPARWILATLALGFALATKLTALMLLPLTLFFTYRTWQRGREAWWRPGLRWATLLPLAGLLVWALYGFELRPIGNFPIPIPAATYFGSLFELQSHITVGHDAFLLGERSSDGWWSYFVVAFLLKTPLLTIGLVGTAVYLIIRHHRWSQTMVLWLPALTFFVVASTSRLNIGYRHILPILPPLLLLAALAGAAALHRLQQPTTRRSLRLFAPLLLLWYASGTVRYHPHYLTYFNELIGGSSQGYRYLSDSNLDWGQDLKLLAAYLHVNPTARFSYYGAVANDPAYYGLNQSPLYTKSGAPHQFTPANPQLGQYALSATHVQGLELPDVDILSWFWHHEPDGNLGYSILLYDIEAATTGDWFGRCLDPAPILDEAAAAELVGQTSLRSFVFDCHHSWVFPPGAGWYLLPLAESWPLAEQFPDNLRPVYTHHASSTGPNYEVYYWDGQVDVAAWAAKQNREVMAQNGRFLPLPLRYDNIIDLVGYRRSGKSWWSVWQVAAPANTGSLTLGAHLYTGDEAPLVADGLGYTSEQWQPGDVFVQISEFAENGCYLDTGLYDYTTGQRLTYTTPDGSGDFVQLPR
ncbi:MAG: glycosyltransferase family 39 protein [Ardenticatenaceae bacterium]|nr:glycosyltransferase family 39 protein [Ardenticatenaceae bacterium]